MAECCGLLVGLGLNCACKLLENILAFSSSVVANPLGVFSAGDVVVVLLLRFLAIFHTSAASGLQIVLVVCCSRCCLCARSICV